MSFSPTSRQIVLQEVFDEASVPTDEEIHDYALKIGINIENEPHLLYLAQDGLMEALPQGWKPCYDEDRREIYYFNFKTGKAQWEHPLDEVYRNLVKKVRNETVVTADQVDDDSRTSIKEDLKSFEEASLILQSSEMYPRPKVLEPLSPLGLGTFKKSPTALTPMKKSPSKELLKSGILKLPINIDEEPLPIKTTENEMNVNKKITFDETEVRKRPNSSDIRNRRNIGPVEFRHLSKQEIIMPKHFGKSSFQLESKKLNEFSKLNDLQNNENKTSESIAVTKDEGYGTEFSVSSMGDKENEMRGIAGKKELSLTGGGSVFLKTNKNKFSPSSDLVSLSLSKEEFSEGLGSSMDGKKSSSDVDSNSKGILRDQKYFKSTEKQSPEELKILSRKNSQEDRKSVRFNLEKDLKINFELPLDYRSQPGEGLSAESKNPSMKNPLTTVKSATSEVNEKSKQIEIDFEDLNIDFGEDFTGDVRKEIEEKKVPLSIELKTVKPKKFKSSHALVQEFREVFEVKNKSKNNFPSPNVSSPLKVEEAVTKHSEEEKENDEKKYSDEENDIRYIEKLQFSSDKKSDMSAESGKLSLNNLIDLNDNDIDETKDSSSIGESQKETGKTEHSFKLRDEIFDSDFSGLVDFALKRKIFENGAAKSEPPKDVPTPKPRGIFKEKTLLDEILRVDEKEMLSDDRLHKEESFNFKSDSECSEKKSDDMSGRYEKRKNEKLKSLEANFNEWLSETEKQFEDKKSNALIKMKEKFEDWKASRESELTKIYSEKREEETQNKFKELRNEFLKREQEEIENLKDQLEKERKEKLDDLKAEHENEIVKEMEKIKKLMEERLNDEKSNLMRKHKEELEKMEKNLEEIISEKQAHKMKELEIARENEAAIEAMQSELKENYQKHKMNLVREHELLLDNIRQQHAFGLENLRVEFKNEEEALRKFHADRLDEIRMKLTAIETKKLDLSENQKPEVNDTRIYEKVRCEKRLLEDKYKTLKEKYVRLKAEAKLTLDRKHKKEVAATASETEKSSSNKSNSIFRRSDCDSSNSKKNQENEKKLKLKKAFANLDNFHHNLSTTEEEENISSRNTPSVLSPNEIRKMKKSPEALNKLRKNEEKHVVLCENMKEDSRIVAEIPSAEEFKKNHSNETKKRRQLFSRLKAASTSRINSQSRSQEKESPRLSPVENLRRQLKKLEELEDQFPVTTHTDTYMRYPFTDIPQFGSSEIEFFKHRIHLERESVRRAKESLKAQKKSFENRQRELKQKIHEGAPDAKSVMEQIYQEERELTDMEVSVHRTRALLGEKIIRLRHLEQSLKRISEPRKKESFINKDFLGRLGFRSQAKEEDRTLSDLSSHSGSSGFSSTDFNDTHNVVIRGWNKTTAEESRRQFQNNMQESTEIIQSLENLNSEIREIWEVLKKQQQSGQSGALLLPPPPLIYGDAMWPSLTLTPPLAFRNTVITSSTNVERSVAQQLKNQVAGNANYGHVTTVVDASLVDRTKSLRDWLKAARSSSTPSEVISPSQVTL